MKAKTKQIFGTILTVSALVSCGGISAYYGPGPNIDNSDDYIEQIAAENSQIVTFDENVIKEQK